MEVAWVILDQACGVFLFCFKTPPISCLGGAFNTTYTLTLTLTPDPKRYSIALATRKGSASLLNFIIMSWEWRVLFGVQILLHF